MYIEHRLMMEQRLHRDTDEVTRDPRNKFPPELMRRLYVIRVFIASFCGVLGVGRHCWH